MATFRQKDSQAQKIVKAALLVLLTPIILPLAVVGIVLHVLNKITVYLFVWVLWLPRGKDILLVYSDSQIWQEYMTTQILPLVRERAIVLNWSHRSKWPRWSFPVYVFRSIGGRQNFNPMVALFRPFRGATVFRFFAAFKDWKRGQAESVEQQRRDLMRAL
jgi:hypothetical protein